MTNLQQLALIGWPTSACMPWSAAPQQSCAVPPACARSEAGRLPRARFVPAPTTQQLTMWQVCTRCSCSHRVWRAPGCWACCVLRWLASRSPTVRPPARGAASQIQDAVRRHGGVASHMSLPVRDARLSFFSRNPTGVLRSYPNEALVDAPTLAHAVLIVVRPQRHCWLHPAVTIACIACHSSVCWRSDHSIAAPHARLQGYDNTERFWLIKNSWGTAWADGGFARIGYGQLGLAGACVCCTRPHAVWRHALPLPCAPRRQSVVVRTRRTPAPSPK